MSFSFLAIRNRAWIGAYFCSGRDTLLQQRRLLPVVRVISLTPHRIAILMDSKLFAHFFADLFRLNLVITATK